MAFTPAPVPALHRFDRTLGGLEMELRLREHLAKLFNEQRKGQAASDVRDNARAMAKLLREANRLKTVLSANADHMAQVSGQPLQGHVLPRWERGCVCWARAGPLMLTSSPDRGSRG